MPTGAEKRAARFEASQAQLTPEELEVQTDQNRALSEKQLSPLTVKEYEKAQTWFTEFMSHQHPEVNVERTFFTPGAAESLSFPIFKEYARYLCRSRQGQLSDRLSVKTVQYYMAMCIGIIERRSKRRLLEIRHEVSNFIISDLARQEGLRRQMWTKGVAFTHDVTFILDKLYEPQYLASFRNMRVVLNLTLYINLVIDLCGRGGEIARHPLKREHMCLRWEDIELYAFSNSGASELDIRMNIKVRWAKNQTMNESEYKVVPFPRLLPASRALEDSLRLILNLALMDGVFDDGISTWEDLYQIGDNADISKTGRRIRFRREMLEVPVLRRMDHHKLTKDPVQTVDIHPQIRRLGQYCGLENRLIAYCFRRGAANVLASQTTTENRRFLLGHGEDGLHDGRRDPFRPYQSRISTIDFPAMFRGLEQISVLPQAGITLNRSDNAPVRISDAGTRHVMADPEVTEATRRLETVRSKILKKYYSVAAASRANDELSESFQILYNERKSLVEFKTRRVFQEEYRAHFETLSARPLSQPQTATSGVYAGHAQASGSSTHAGLPPIFSQPVNVNHRETAFNSTTVENEASLTVLPDHMCDELDGVMPFSNDSTSLDDVDVNNDARRVFEDHILSDILGEERDQTTPTAGPDNNYSQQEVRPVSTLHRSKGGAQIHADSSNSFPTDGNQQSTRLHGLPPQIVGRGGNRSMMIKGNSAYNDMQAEIDGAGDNDASISKCLISWYSITHGIDDFFSGQEPHAGTFECRFCGKDLHQCHHTYEHVFSCAKKDARSQAERLREEVFPLDRPCEYQRCGERASFGQFVPCGETFRTMKEQGEHMRSHMRTMTKTVQGVKKPTCFFKSCARNPQGGRLNRDGPDFDSQDDLLHHLWTEHRVSTTKTTEPLFCDYCHTWLLQPHEWLSHAERHLGDAQKVVSQVRYAGYLAGRVLMPRICPFCFHDEDLPTHRRIDTYESTYSMNKHVLGHLREMESDGGKFICPCFPTMCTEISQMDIIRMSGHLRDVHLIDTGNLNKGKRCAEPLEDITNVTGGSRLRK